jgi:hypothetical protein
VNAQLLALGTKQSGNSAPSVTYPYMDWADTAAGLWKQRNAANDEWVTIGTLGSANLGLAPLASPTFTGTPAAPTATAGTNTTQLATTAYVVSQSLAKTGGTMTGDVTFAGTQPQVCKAWVNFNGTGTVAIRASYNVSSITDNGVGDYTVNFTTPLADDKYSCSGSIKEPAATPYNLHVLFQYTTSARIKLSQPGVNTYDNESISVAIFR